MKQTLLITTALMLVVGVSDAQTYKGMRFNDDGSKSFETYKESKGKLELVKKVSWYSNGNKESEGTFKDGLKDRKWTYWGENGQKRYEETWKGGKLVGGTEDSKGYSSSKADFEIWAKSYVAKPYAEILLPDPKVWFKEHFESEDAGKLLEEYIIGSEGIASFPQAISEARDSGQEPLQISTVSILNIEEGTGLQSNALNKMKTPVTLYSFRINGIHFWSFVHHKGSFKIVGKMRAIR